ncbi:hypothetical protein GQ43DRAFT_281958 [Delitschia confertaspora ATCC 74209]|uniref:Uncharacterized protein n=1 Tax=Delitschia confertaspora ATCC 74209 TaxID=1513339 RepID=A0A9P4JP62_9PLEO|nr:hypothetical protein GQ43DRAFT_281958 [Delitschia confertaspora ATCC 74209]
MRLGYQQPPNPTPIRNDHTKGNEKSQQPIPRQHVRRVTESQQPQPIRPVNTLRRNVSRSEPNLAPLPRPVEIERPKSPVYLTVKNPYDTILGGNRLQHQENKPAIKEGPPSQGGSSVEGRPRASGFRSLSRPKTELEPIVLPPLYSKLSAPSVQNARKFWETKVAKAQSPPPPPPPPPLPPTAPKVYSTYPVAARFKDEEPRGVAATTRRRLNHDAGQNTSIGSEKRGNVTHKNLDASLPTPRSPLGSPKLSDVAQRPHPFTRPKTEAKPKSLVPEIFIRPVSDYETVEKDPAVAPKEQSVGPNGRKEPASSQFTESKTSSTKCLTSIFEEPRRIAGSFDAHQASHARVDHSVTKRRFGEAMDDINVGRQRQGSRWSETDFTLRRDLQQADAVKSRRLRKEEIHKSADLDRAAHEHLTALRGQSKSVAPGRLDVSDRWRF